MTKKSEPKLAVKSDPMRDALDAAAGVHETITAEEVGVLDIEPIVEEPVEVKPTFDFQVSEKVAADPTVAKIAEATAKFLMSDDLHAAIKKIAHSVGANFADFDGIRYDNSDNHYQVAAMKFETVDGIAREDVARMLYHGEADQFNPKHTIIHCCLEGKWRAATLALAASLNDPPAVVPRELDDFKRRFEDYDAIVKADPIKEK